MTRLHNSGQKHYFGQNNKRGQVPQDAKITIMGKSKIVTIYQINCRNHNSGQKDKINHVPR